MLEIIFVNDKNAPETVLRIRKHQVLSLKWAKSQTKTVLFFTKYSIFIVNVKSGRFMYQSVRAGDEAKKRKSPAKSGRVGIYALFKFVSTVLFHRPSVILGFMEVTADYSFPDFRSPFPAPRSPF